MPKVFGDIEDIIPIDGGFDPIGEIFATGGSQGGFNDLFADPNLFNGDLGGLDSGSGGFGEDIVMDAPLPPDEQPKAVLTPQELDDLVKKRDAAYKVIDNNPDLTTEQANQVKKAITGAILTAAGVAYDPDTLDPVTLSDGSGLISDRWEIATDNSASSGGAVAAAQSGIASILSSMGGGGSSTASTEGSTASTTTTDSGASANTGGTTEAAASDVGTGDWVYDADAGVFRQSGGIETIIPVPGTYTDGQVVSYTDIADIFDSYGQNTTTNTANTPTSTDTATGTGNGTISTPLLPTVDYGGLSVTVTPPFNGPLHTVEPLPTSTSDGTNNNDGAGDGLDSGSGTGSGAGDGSDSDSGTGSGAGSSAGGPSDAPEPALGPAPGSTLVPVPEPTPGPTPGPSDGAGGGGGGGGPRRPRSNGRSITDTLFGDDLVKLTPISGDIITARQFGRRQRRPTLFGGFYDI